MARTIFGQPRQERKRKADAREGRDLIREREQMRRDFEKLKMKGPPPKTGLRA